MTSAVLIVFGLMTLTQGDIPHAGMHNVHVFKFMHKEDCDKAAVVMFKSMDVVDAICVEVR